MENSISQSKLKDDLKPDEVPELTIKLITIQQKQEEQFYYWKFDPKNSLSEILPPNLKLVGITKNKNNKLKATRNRIKRMINSLTEKLSQIGDYSKITKEYVHEIKDLIKKISINIYQELELRDVFNILFEYTYIDSEFPRPIIISTDDFDIPWDWAINNDSVVLGKKHIIGYLDIHKTNKYKNKYYHNYSDNQFYKSLVALRQGTIIIIANLSELFDVKKNIVYKEISNLAKKFLYKQFTNISIICTIDSVKENAEDFKKVIEGFFNANELTKIKITYTDDISIGFNDEIYNKDNIQIIHYVGNIQKDGAITQNNGLTRMTPNKILGKKFEKNALMEPSSLLFLNSFISSSESYYFDNPTSLPSTFASLGVNICFAPRFKTNMPFAEDFTNVFYDVLLREFGIPTYKLITNFREEWRVHLHTLRFNVISEEIKELCLNLPPLVFIYGNPAFCIFPLREVYEVKDVDESKKPHTSGKNLNVSFGKGPEYPKRENI